MATCPRTNQSPFASRRTLPPSGSVSSSISPTTSSMMSSTVTIPAVRPYSSITTASDVRWRWRSANRSSSGLVSGTIGASRTRPSIVAPVPSVSSSCASPFACTMPFTRSWLSSSVTTSRVWPEETQRRLDVLGEVDRDDRRRRRHHLPRLLLVQVEDAGEHPGLAGVELAAGERLLDEDLELLGRLALYQAPAGPHAEYAQDRVRGAVEQHDERMEHPREQLQPRRDEERD